MELPLNADERIRTRIVRALQDDDFLSAAEAEEAAFHMTDWLADLRELVEWYEEPDARSDAEVQKLLLQFLVHAPAHVAAAARTVSGDPLRDVFEIGAVLGDGIGTRKPGEPYPKSPRRQQPPESQ